MNRCALAVVCVFGVTLLGAAVPGQSERANVSGATRDGDRLTLPAGASVSVRMADAVDSRHNHSGDLLTGIVDPSVLVNDQVVIPRGTEAHIRLVEDKKGGHVKGKAEVRLELISLILNGQQIGVDTNDYDKSKGSMKGKMENGAKSAGAGSIDAATAAGPGGAVVGGVIGIFSAPRIQVQANSRINFTLAQPFTFVPPAVTPPEL